MNKSKLVKKSLAMILAVLMIVAMIPVAASAASLTISEFTVNNKQATISDTTITATISSTANVKLGAVIDTGVAISYKDKNGTEITGGNAAVVTVTDLTAVAAKDGNVYTMSVVTKTDAAGDSAGNTKTYTIKLTHEQSASSNDATISYVKTIAATTAVAPLVSYDVDSNSNPKTITITIPFGKDPDAYMAKVDGDADLSDGNTGNFVPTSSTAKSCVLSGVANNTGILTVTAQDNTTAKYSVKVVAEKGFTAFSVPGQTKSTVKANGSVDIEMPFGTPYGAGNEIIPTFSVGSNIKKVTLNDETTEVISGETELLFTAGGGPAGTASVTGTHPNLKLWLQDDTKVAVSIVCTNPEKNPAKAMTLVQVGAATDSNPVTIAAGTTNVKVEMKKDFNFAVDGAAVTIKGTASAFATVTVPAQGINDTDADDEGFELANVSIIDKTVTIRVAAQDTSKGYTDYKITFDAATVANPNVTDVALKGKDAAGKDVTYDVASGNVKIVNYEDAGKKLGTITITVPYRLVDTTVAGGFDVYYTHATGATITSNGALPATGAADLATWMGDDFPASFNHAAAGAKEWTVTASDGTVRTYTVTLKTSTAGSTLQRITSAQVVGTNNNALITDDNTYKATVTQRDASGAKQATTGTAGQTYNTIEVTLPYSYDTAVVTDTNAWFKSLTASDGAVVYISDSTDLTAASVDKITALSATAKGAQDVAGIKADSGKLPTNAVNAADGKIILANCLKVWVVCEQNAVNITATKVAAGEVYYVYGVKASVGNNQKSITKATSTLDTKVTATLGNDRTINITVPASYNSAAADVVTPTDATDGDIKAFFTLNFTVSKMAQLKVNTTVLKGDLGTEAGKAAATKFYVVDGDLYATNDSTTGVKVTGAVIQAEDTTTTPATINLTVAKAQSGANLLSAKANSTTGSIGTKSVTFNLPYGSKLNPVKLTLTADPMATITVTNGSTTAAYDPNANYDLNLATKITVQSEDKKWTNIYEVTAKVGEQFSDIKPTDWYYSYVTTAAAKGIVKGYDDGTFRPMLSISRQDFAVMTVRALGLDDTTLTATALPFKDVTQNYAAGAIAYCKEHNIIGGYPDGTFKPTATISRAEAAKIIAVAFNLSGTPTEGFKDEAKLGWAKDYANACKAAGIFGGDNLGNFNGSTNIKRCETAKVMVEASK